MARQTGTGFMAFGALRDVRVLDLTQMLAGPYGTMMLADHGAEVIKIESPQGDMTRPGGPFAPDDTQKTHGGYFQSINRNKRSIVLDLKTKRGRATFLKLVENADVVAENFRHGVMERLGLSYETLKQKNPRLVYACLRGFGDARTGRSPYMEWPAFDVVAQAMGGIMGITGPDPDTPTKIGPGVGDIIPGMMMAFGILAALHHARQTGDGQFVDVAMVDGVLAVCERMVYQHALQKENPGPEGNHHPFLVPFGAYPAKDGFVTIATPQDGFFKILCQQIGAEDLLSDARFTSPQQRMAHRQDLIAAISQKTVRFTKAELKAKLGGRIPMGPVMQIADMMQDPHFRARDMFPAIETPGRTTKSPVAGVPIKLTRTPGGVHRRGPYLGEDTRAVLKQAGLTVKDVNDLLKADVAMQHTPVTRKAGKP